MEYKIKVTIGHDGALDVFTNAALDMTYERLFQSALADSQTVAQTPDTGIRLIVFGCFWLEAACNETLKDLLETVKPEAAAMSLWKITERAPFLSKFSLASAFAKSPDTERVKRLLGDLKQVFGLRNRLAHFKDQDTLIAQDLPVDDFAQIAQGHLGPELLQHLQPPRSLSYAQSISDGINWLKEVREQYYPSESAGSNGK